QDIYTQIPGVLGHSCEKSLKEGYHTINISKGSMMYDIFGKEELLVNSLHHQACRDLGNNLEITAKSKEGIIEAIESTNDKFILGVQFHPESMSMKYKEFLKPFKYFIQSCVK